MPLDHELKSRSYLKNSILVPDRGGAEFQTAGNLLVVEDLKRGTNKEMGTKDIFEIASKNYFKNVSVLRFILKQNTALNKNSRVASSKQSKSEVTRLFPSETRGFPSPPYGEFGFID